MSALVVDTYAVVWYLLGSSMLSPVALAAIEDAIGVGDSVYVPSICVVELAYLVEKGKLPEPAFQRLASVLTDSDSSLTVAPLDQAVAEAVRHVARAAVPDMPDRIIAATALHLGVPLVTRDRKIRAAGISSIW